MDFFSDVNLVEIKLVYYIKLTNLSFSKLNHLYKVTKIYFEYRYFEMTSGFAIWHSYFVFKLINRFHAVFRFWKNTPMEVLYV